MTEELLLLKVESCEGPLGKFVGVVHVLHNNNSECSQGLEKVGRESIRAGAGRAGKVPLHWYIVVQVRHPLAGRSNPVQRRGVAGGNADNIHPALRRFKVHAAPA